jgi:hypothetical protein
LKETIQYNSLPHSIATGYFNEDHYLDIVVANHGSNNIGILLGNGDGTFQRQVPYPTGTSSLPEYVIIHDFNNDTLEDIVVANFGSHSLNIFIGNGHGSFINQMTLSTGASRPLALALGDFNNDTRLDFAIVNYGTDSIGILLQLNDGTFTSPIEYLCGYDSDPRSLAIGDINNDGFQDIVVSNFGTSNIGIFLGYGNGSLQKQISISTGSGSHPHSIALGDLNKDNQLDIVVTNTNGDNIGAFLGYGNGSFRDMQTYSTGFHSSSYSLAVAYINDDNILDIVVSNSLMDTIGVFIGYENGTFRDMTAYSTGYGSNPLFVIVGDFNNDNRIDIAVANNGSNSVGIFLSDRTINFGDPITYSTDDGSSPSWAAVSDFNNDNHLDVVVVNTYSNTIGVFLGFGNGSFTNQMIFSTGDWSSPTSVAVGDFNNDLYSDIVVSNYYSDNVGVFFGFGNGSFAEQNTFSTGYSTSPISVAVGDFNNDHWLDIVAVLTYDNNVGILLGFGNGTFTDPILYSTCAGCSPQTVAVGKFNNDSNLDFVVANNDDNNLAVFFGSGNGTFANPITYSTQEQSFPAFVNVGDLNNDRIMDIIVPIQWRDLVGFFLSNGNGSFGYYHAYYVGYQVVPTYVVTGDFNNDNLTDFIVSNSYVNYLSIFRGLGNEIFSSAIQLTIQVPIGSNFLVTGDFNEDGRLDLISVNHDGNFIAVFLGYDAGIFRSMIEFSTSYALLPTSITIGDFNQDKRMDLGVSNFASSNFDIYIGYDNGSFIIENTFSTGDNSQPQMLLSADLNNDNILDIAVTNTGNDNIGIFLGYGNGSFQSMKTYDTGSQSLPYSLSVSDFNNDNRSDLVVANFGSNNIGIILGFDIGAYTALPVLIIYSAAQQYLQYIAIGDFNNDNISDIVFIDRIDAIVGIFLTQNNGTFLNPTTYSTGGSSPTCIAAGDFNNDKHLDIIITNRDSNNIGLLFGYGNGTFIGPITSSTGTNFTPKTLAIGDFNNDNQLDIVIGDSSTNQIGILLGLNNGTFSNMSIYFTRSGSTPSSLAVGDFNNNTYLDIVVADYGSGNIEILLGYGNGTMANSTVYSTTGTFPIGVAVGDFNNDNRLDIVVVTFDDGVVAVYLGYGNGTFANPIIASAGGGAQPQALTVGDFNNDNRLDVAVAAAYQ